MSRKSSMRTQSKHTSKMPNMASALRDVTRAIATHREIMAGERTLKALDTVCELLRILHTRIENLESLGKKPNILGIRRAA